MYIAVFMGPFARNPSEDFKLIDLCLEQAVQAADAGFSLITFGEQHFNGYEPYSNPFLMGARLAPFLKNSYFGTTICPVVFHHPLRFVEEVNILDYLTKGKLIVGMSAGRVGFSPDFANFGLDPKERDAIFASKLDIMLRAWAHKPGDAPIEIDTKWDKAILNGRMMPMSYRVPHPHLAIGTNTDATVQQTGERGWPVFLGPCQLKDAVHKFGWHRHGLAASGLSKTQQDDCIRKSLVTRHVIVGETEDEAWKRAELMLGMNPLMDRSKDKRSLREMAAVDLESVTGKADPFRKNAEHIQSWLICGTPDSVYRQVKAYGDAGIPQLHTRFTVGGYNPDDIKRSFKLFVDEVMPKLDPQQFPAPLGAEVRSFDPEGPAGAWQGAKVDHASKKPWEKSVMANVDGDWKVTVKTPMGAQSQTLSLKTAGDNLSGSVQSPMAKLEIADGKVVGNELSWSMEMTQPFAMKFEVRALIDGDKISGEVKSNFGVSPMEGARAA